MSKERLEERNYRQDLVDEHIERLEQQNKRYRKALEFYADKENYKEFNDIMRTRKVTMILEDSGIKARQALEGDTQ